MNIPNADKLRAAEAALGLRFPKKLFDILRKLEKDDLYFGESMWLVPSLTNNEGTVKENFIINASASFGTLWKLKAIVFAVNKEDDLILLLANENGEMRKEVFVLPAQTNELKIFHYTLDKLLIHGPLEYSKWDAFYLKLVGGALVHGTEHLEEETNG